MKLSNRLFVLSILSLVFGSTLWQLPSAEAGGASKGLLPNSGTPEERVTRCAKEQIIRWSSQRENETIHEAAARTLIGLCIISERAGEVTVDAALASLSRDNTLIISMNAARATAESCLSQTIPQVNAAFRRHFEASRVQADQCVNQAERTSCNNSSCVVDRVLAYPRTVSYKGRQWRTNGDVSTGCASRCVFLSYPGFPIIAMSCVTPMIIGNLDKPLVATKGLITTLASVCAARSGIHRSDTWIGTLARNAAQTAPDRHPASLDAAFRAAELPVPDLLPPEVRALLPR